MNDLENKIRQNADNSSFEFKEEYWDATLVKLKQAEKALLFKKIGWMFFGIIAIGSIGYFGFMKDNISLNSNEIAQNKIQNNNLNSSNLNSTNNTNNNSLNNSINNSNEQLINENNPVNSVNEINSSRVDNENNLKPEVSPLNSGKITPNSKNEWSPSSRARSSKSAKPSTNEPDRNFSADFYTKKEKEELENLKESQERNKSNYERFNRGSINKENRRNESLSFLLEDVSQIEYSIYGNSNSSYASALLPVFSVNNIGRKLIIQAFVGTNISKSYVDNKTNFDLPYAGIEVGYKFNNQLLLTLGTGWYQKSGLDYEIVSESESKYSFGLKKTTKSILMDKSYWLEIPIKLSYPLYNNNHRIGLGFAYSHLLGAKSIYKTTHILTDYNKEIKPEPETEEPIYSSTELMNSSSYSVLGSYQFQYNRFGTEIKYNFGLNDIIKNDFVNNENMDRNSRVTITLKYSIF